MLVKFKFMQRIFSLDFQPILSAGEKEVKKKNRNWKWCDMNAIDLVSLNIQILGHCDDEYSFCELEWFLFGNIGNIFCFSDLTKKE